MIPKQQVNIISNSYYASNKFDFEERKKNLKMCDHAHAANPLLLLLQTRWAICESVIQPVCHFFKPNQTVIISRSIRHVVLIVLPSVNF